MFYRTVPKGREKHAAKQTLGVNESMRVEKPKRKAKLLQVPDCSTKTRFLATAGKVWDAHHPEGTSKGGAPNVASDVFEACEKVIDQILEDVSKKRNKFHGKHFPDDPEEALMSFDDCAVCRKNGKLNRYSVYRIQEEVAKILPHKKPKNPKAETKPWGKRTQENHIKAWLHIQHHDQWFEKGVPKNCRNRFDDGELEAFEKLRMSRQRNIDATIKQIKAKKLSKAAQEEKIHDFLSSMALTPYAIQRYFPDHLNKKK